MKKILIVDDEVSIRQTLKYVIEKLGYSTILCSDGLQALSILEMNKDISIVISDMQMPVMTGREFIIAKRDIKAISEIPVIMISGYIKFKEVADLLENGAHRFIAKPVRAEALAEYINQLLDTEAVLTV